MVTDRANITIAFEYEVVYRLSIGILLSLTLVKMNSQRHAQFEYEKVANWDTLRFAVYKRLHGPLMFKLTHVVATEKNDWRTYFYSFPPPPEICPF